MPDPVHLLVERDPQFGIHRFLQLVQGEHFSSVAICLPQAEARLPSRWTNSHFVASVGGAP